MAAIVQAALSSRRRARKTVEEERLEGYLAIPAKQLLERIERLDDVLEEERTGKTFGFGSVVSQICCDRCRRLEAVER